MRYFSNSRDYETWSFKDRTFLMILGLSFLWHLFWFFSITIVVSPTSQQTKTRPVIVSIGPVLSDELLRTLVDTRVQKTETFYRPLSEFSSATDIPRAEVQKYSSGDVVSLPFGEKFFNALKDIVGGKKATPDYGFTPKIKTGYSEEMFEMEGELKNRQVISRPTDPRTLWGYPAGSTKQGELIVELVVNAEGAVVTTNIILSSGNQELDNLWVRYLSSWRFGPASFSKPFLEEKGRVHINLNNQGLD